jgi:hypothetical protein
MFSPSLPGAPPFHNLLRVAPMPAATLTSCCYEFIKRYLTPVMARRTVDVAVKSVYVAARNLVFGLTLLPRSRFWAAPQVKSKTWLVTAHSMSAWAFNRKRERNS